MNNYFGSLLTFQMERPVFLREQAKKTYSIGPYFMTKNMIDQPVTAITTLIEMALIYWCVGFIPGVLNFLKMTLVFWLVSQTAQGLGLIMSAVFKDMISASAAGPLVTMPMILFGGQFANASTFPAYLAWISYCSPIRYGF